MKSWVEEFEKTYNRPQINNITVGFSGIDPAPKSILNLDTPEEEQAVKDFVKEQVDDYMTVTDIIIDSGEIT